MSKIERVRIINLNYNNNTMHVDDELFHFNGESTFLSLRNGGGKSVMVQILLAPFIKKKTYRDLHDRKFSSFFTTSLPTYILVEWALDGGANRVLTGMMVRKRTTQSDEDSKDDLEMINFVHEYNEANPYDIEQIPFVEENEASKKVKGFVHSRQLFEQLKKESLTHFNYFDMNNSNQAKNYFEKLKEFKINHKEWEDIIRKINLEESGLSTLFKDAKNEKGLIDKWFLESIETKLNREEDKVKNFRKIVLSYAKQFRENKSKIEKRVAINEFFKDELGIKEKTQVLKENLAEIEQYENQIANFIHYLDTAITNLSTTKERITEQVDIIDQEIDDLKYEKLSIEIYKNSDKKDEMEGNLQKWIADLANQIEMQQNLIQRKRILECARIYEEYKEFSEEVQGMENTLEVMRKSSEDFTPEINNLGYTLNRYYQNEIEKNQHLMKENEEKLADIATNKKSVTIQLLGWRENQTKVSESKGELRSKIKSFDELEKKFNRLYNEQFSRNLLGVYEDGFLTAKEVEYKNWAKNIRKIIEENIQIIYDNKETKKQNGRELSETDKKKIMVASELKNVELKLKNYQEKITTMKDILKYINFSEDQLFEKEKVIAAFNVKIQQLNEEVEKVKREKQVEEKALSRLKTGTISELPKEIEDEFRNKDIYYTSGLEWMRNNRYSIEKNNQLVKNNPFLPYALIMNTRDLEKLEKNPMEKFTSFPIIIINREDLIDDGEVQESKLVHLGKVNFLVSFNQQLIDETALQQLIEAKEKIIQSIQLEIDRKEQEKNEYENRRNWVVYNGINKIDYDTAINQEQQLTEEQARLDEQLIQFRSKMELAQQEIDKAEGIKQSEVKKEAKVIDLRQSFVDLTAAYKEYGSNREKFEQAKIKEENLIRNIGISEKQLSTYDREKESLEASARELIKKKEIIDQSLEKYRTYKEGELISKDVEDVQSRFESLTTEIKEDMKTLQDNLAKALGRFKKKERELTDKQTEYDLEEIQFKEKPYDSFEEKQVKSELQGVNQQIETNKTTRNEMEMAIRLKENNIQHQLDDLKEKFDKEIPKERSVLKEIDFAEKIERFKLEQNRQKSELASVIDQMEIVTRNKAALFEYEELVVLEPVVIQVAFKAITKSRKEMIRDYKAVIEIKNTSKSQLDKEVERIIRKDIYYTEDFFKKPLEILRELTNSPEDLLENLTTTSNSYRSLMDKLNADIELIEKEKSNVLQNLFDYVYEVHENLGKIDRNSSITLRGRSLKMLRVVVPNWEEHEGVYKERLIGFLDRIVNRIVEALDNNESVDDKFSYELTTKNLYDEIVWIGNIDIKLYKIEENKEYPISWSEVAKNSGGEGFLSAFVILTSLLSYMGREDTDIFSEKENSKVLIMDNPFAQTNAEHLLKPLMEMAKKSNTQLICFSGLGGDSIYNRFDNIYVLNLLSSKLKKNMSYLKVDHLKGEDSNLDMISSNFQIIEDATQESLF